MQATAATANEARHAEAAAAAAQEAAAVAMQAVHSAHAAFAAQTAESVQAVAQQAAATAQALMQSTMASQAHLKQVHEMQMQQQAMLQEQQQLLLEQTQRSADEMAFTSAAGSGAAAVESVRASRSAGLGLDARQRGVYETEGEDGGEAMQRPRRSRSVVELFQGLGIGNAPPSTRPQRGLVTTVYNVDEGGSDTQQQVVPTQAAVEQPAAWDVEGQEDRQRELLYGDDSDDAPEQGSPRGEAGVDAVEHTPPATAPVREEVPETTSPRVATSPVQAPTEVDVELDLQLEPAPITRGRDDGEAPSSLVTPRSEADPWRLVEDGRWRRLGRKGQHDNADHGGPATTVGAREKRLGKGYYEHGDLGGTGGDGAGGGGGGTMSTAQRWSPRSGARLGASPLPEVSFLDDTAPSRVERRNRFSSTADPWAAVEDGTWRRSAQRGSSGDTRTRGARSATSRTRAAAKASKTRRGKRSSARHSSLDNTDYASDTVADNRNLKVRERLRGGCRSERLLDTYFCGIGLGLWMTATVP